MMPPAPPSPIPAAEPAWTEGLLENPHAVGDKARRVNQMFSAIAPSYDLNNRLHSMGMDQHWRSVAVKMAGVRAGDRIVDVACGTGDLTVKFWKQWSVVSGQWSEKGEVGRGKGEGGRGKQEGGGVMGVDFTYEMLPLAREKARRWGAGREAGSGKREARSKKQEARSLPVFVQGDALALPVGDGSVDIVSIAFGIRNVADWGKAIEEFARVLRPGGRLVILEFSLPTNRVMRGLYNFYFWKIMPRTATWISGDKTGAYKYLPESVNTFIGREAMQERMSAAGFGEVVARAMTGGICVCYRGVRK